MKIKCSVFIATSVDGFIAKPDGDVNWLHKPEYATGEDFGYDAFIKNIDLLIMGRKSFEKVRTFDPWPYDTIPVVVLTSKSLDIPESLSDKVRVDSGEPEQIIERLALEGNQHFYIDGGATIQRFLEAKLIHELTITNIPVLLSSGIHLFCSTGTEAYLELDQTLGFSNGFVQSKYRLVYPD